MIVTNEKVDISLFKFDYFNVPKENIAFFDIETTGFSPRSSNVYLIGVLYYSENSFHTIQWFSEDKYNEAAILASFYEFIQNHKILIHFNGDGFDIPYINYKFKKYNLPYSLDHFISIDLLKRIRKAQKLLKLENCKQKTVETFLEINREDIYSGKQLIDIYAQYLLVPSNQNFIHLLLLHNKEDICGLLRLLPSLSYLQALEGNYTLNSLIVQETIEYDGTRSKEAIFSADLPLPVPKRVSASRDSLYLSIFERSMKLRVKIYSGELKYFYSNYKDYFYLPDEDTCIHKSIAFYVDKNYRTKAKAAECYSKKTGKFLPQYNEIVSPYFKIDYTDKTTYFELEDDFINNILLKKQYVDSIIKILL